MHILVEMDGVVRTQQGNPISTGILLVAHLTAYNKLTFISSESRLATEQWMNVNKIVDFDNLIDSSVGLHGESLIERQITMARSQSPIDLVITNNPRAWAFAFDQGIPSIMFGVPSYTRPEFRPDAPKRLRAWNDIETAIEKQNEAMTKDARVRMSDEDINFA